MTVDEELILEMGDEEDLLLDMDGGEDLELGITDPVPLVEKDYEKLKNKPRINGVELIGDQTSKQLKIKETEPLTNLEIEEIIQSVFGGE